MHTEVTWKHQPVLHRISMIHHINLTTAGAFLCLAPSSVLQLGFTSRLPNAVLFQGTAQMPIINTKTFHRVLFFLAKLPAPLNLIGSSWHQHARDA